MKKLYLLLSLIVLMANNSFAQCNVDTTTNTFYRFFNPGSQSEFNGFLCSTIDSVGTFGLWGYYDGNGFSVKLIAGTEVTFYTDSCSGNQVSMTLVDSSNIIIAGVYSPPACSNTLDYIAQYTGKYSVVLNLNGICNGVGNTLLGQVYVKIKPGTVAPACSDVINDTICGAIQLQIDSGFAAGNTADAYPTDPMDAYLSSIGATVCSPPNNTMWYYFQSPVSIDTLDIWVTSGVGSNFHSWIVGFLANDPADFCNGGLTFLGCTSGAADELGIDTVSFELYGVQAGQVYVLMVDGFNGGAGPFSIALRSQPYITEVAETMAGSFSVYPNPATDEIRIETNSKIESGMIILTDLSGKIIIQQNITTLNNTTLKTGHISGGIYLLTVMNKNGVFNKKVCISNER